MEITRSEYLDADDSNNPFTLGSAHQFILNYFNRIQDFTRKILPSRKKAKLILLKSEPHPEPWEPIPPREDCLSDGFEFVFH